MARNVSCQGPTPCTFGYDPLAVGIWLAGQGGYLTGGGLTINSTIGKFSGDGLGND